MFHGLPSIMKFKEIDVTIRNGLQIITFNRPAKKNAMSDKMYDEVIAALNGGAKDASVVATALTGAGEYYSSGKEMSSAPTSKGIETAEGARMPVHRLVSAFIDFPKILVAVVNGPAVGVAVTTIGLCDVVYASHKATFHTPFTRLGLSAEGCSTYTFPRIMGKSMASEMLYLNRKINAHEAKACGLVSEVFPHAQFAEEVWPRVENIVSLPSMSLLYSKQLVRHWDTKKLHEANDLECKRLEERIQSEDCANAVLAFFRKQSKV